MSAKKEKYEMNQTYAENGDYMVATLLNSTLLPVRVDNLRKSK